MTNLFEGWIVGQLWNHHCYESFYIAAKSFFTWFVNVWIYCSFCHDAHPHSEKGNIVWTPTFFAMCFSMSQGRNCVKIKKLKLKNDNGNLNKHFIAVFQTVVVFSSLTNCVSLLRLPLTAEEKSQLIAFSLRALLSTPRLCLSASQTFGEIRGVI